eukprot:CAMPEP_0168618554 /NCGR_PEP_ID=MMETSP0449_2-20121227/6133_1 /TAXON_ID=1082188 /ORGANISM="Strombidium rassoulzadegani, Strain ras09" /LENGTH=162 /DNA_ID=CAMNT_0008659435 /DNA_START=443 /DNA_END=932 /DNA_ORIENTATION=-
MTQPTDQTSSSSVAEDELGSPVVAGTDIGDVGFALDELLGAPEVAELDDIVVEVDEDVLGLDVAVADAHGVDVGDGSEELVGVELHEDLGHVLLLLHVVLHDLVEGLWDVLHHHVQVDLVGRVALRVEEVLHLDAEGVSQDLEDLELSVLVPLVLVHLLDRH